ncbi:MAG: hypothetical protein RBG13Loki_3578 [Promethearchaeota archaeon CR_4]|nr:MAG: hypothetical protein RBG13Loki_3578 [Candidatus Lokiarchaeota archaeon CR_4]
MVLLSPTIVFVLPRSLKKFCQELYPIVLGLARVPLGKKTIACIVKKTNSRHPNIISMHAHWRQLYARM